MFRVGSARFLSIPLSVDLRWLLRAPTDFGLRLVTVPPWTLSVLQTVGNVGSELLIFVPRAAPTNDMSLSLVAPFGFGAAEVSPANKQQSETRARAGLL
jgi:hypothetical protein